MHDVVVVGSFVQDLAFSTPRFPAPGESRIGRFATGPGGKGFNQAVAAKRQDVTTLFVGAVGKDMFAQQVRTFAEHERLRCGFEVIDTQASGAASIVVDERGDNLIVVALGANEHLSVAHVERFEREIASAKVLVCQLESSIAAVERALTIARKAGVITILNPAPINDGVTFDTLRDVDILVPNETEFAFLREHLQGVSMAPQYWTGAEEDVHAHCRALGVPTVIVTLGERGCFVSHADDAPRHPTSLPYYKVASADVSPVDSTGAGDAFCGGLAAGLAHVGVGKLNVACQFATRVAGMSTEQAGTAPAMPTGMAVRKRFGLPF